MDSMMDITRYPHLLVGVPLMVAIFWQLRGAGRSFSMVKEEGVKPRVSLISFAFFVTVIEGFNAPLNPYRWMIVPGFAILCFAILLFNAARASIRGKFFSYIYSDDAPQFLHTSGPYRYVRNPFYSSYLLTFLAAAVLAPNLVTIAVPVVMFVFLMFAARHEERKFSRSPDPVAKEYAEYKKRTGMFFPRF